MAEERMERRLAAILAADVAGYSRLVGEDEEGTLAALRALRRELIEPGIAAHKGRIVKTTGDGLLAEFASVVDALRCAAASQSAMAGRPESGIAFRIGIHQRDIVVEDADIFGDGVNIAARLEALAEPGGICVSARVQEDAAGRLDLSFEDLGEPALKNIARAVHVYRVVASRNAPHPPAARVPPSPRERGEGRGEGQQPALEATEIRRSIGLPTTVSTAYDWYLRALPECYSYNAEAQHRARSLLDQVIAPDPSFGPALVQKLLLAIQDDPGYPEPHRTLAACYPQTGRLADAQKVVARLRAITPVVIPDAGYLRNPEQRDLFLSGLRLAIGEEQPREEQRCSSR